MPIRQRNLAEVQSRRGIVRVCQSILAESDARGTYVQARIAVRQLWNAPLWAWPLARIIEDSPQQRFEVYRGSSLWSCQSHTGDSYQANSA